MERLVRTDFGNWGVERQGKGRLGTHRQAEERHGDRGHIEAWRGTDLDYTEGVSAAGISEVEGGR